MISKNKAIIDLLSAVNECVLSESSIKKHIGKRFFVASCYALMWMIVSVIVCVAANVHAEITYDDTVNWQLSLPILFIVTEVSELVFVLIHSLSESLTVICDTAPQTLIFILVYAISGGLPIGVITLGKSVSKNARESF